MSAADTLWEARWTSRGVALDGLALGREAAGCAYGATAADAALWAAEWWGVRPRVLVPIDRYGPDAWEEAKVYNRRR